MAKGETPTRPARPTRPGGRRPLKLRSGLWSLGGQVGFGWHRAPATLGFLDVESSARQLSGWTVSLQPTLGYFVRPAIELTLRPEIVLRFGDLYTTPTFAGHQLGISLGGRAYLLTAGRWSLYLGLHAGISALLREEIDNEVTYLGELEPGLLFGLTANVALRITATFRLEHTPQGIPLAPGSNVPRTSFTWQPTLGLAFFL